MNVVTNIILLGVFAVLSGNSLNNDIGSGRVRASEIVPRNWRVLRDFNLRVDPVDVVASSEGPEVVASSALEIVMSPLCHACLRPTVTITGERDGWRIEYFEFDLEFHFRLKMLAICVFLWFLLALGSLLFWVMVGVFAYSAYAHYR